MQAKVAGLLLLVCAQLMRGVLAAPFAYIPNFGSNDVSVIDTATDTVVATIAVAAGPVGVAVSGDGTRAYVSNTSGKSVSVIDTASNAVIGTVALPVEPYGIAVNRAGTRALVTSIEANAVMVIDTNTRAVVATIPTASRTWGIAIDSTDQFAYVGVFGDGLTNAVAVIRIADSTLTAMIPVPACATGIAANPLGRAVYATNSCGNQAWVVDVVARTYETSVPVPPFPYGIAVNPAGTRVFVASGAGTITVFDASTYAKTASILVDGGGGQPKGVTISPDGLRAYVANQNRNEVLVVDTETNAIVRTIPVGTSPIALGQAMAPAPRVVSPVLEIPTMEREVLAIVAAGLLLLGLARLRDGRIQRSPSGH